MSHKEVLETIYNEALAETVNANYTTDLSDETVAQIKLIVSRSEANKGLIAVLTTLLYSITT